MAAPPPPLPMLLLLLLLYTAMLELDIIHRHHLTFMIAPVYGLQFSMPNFAPPYSSNITLVNEGGWYTNNGYGSATFNLTESSVVLNELTSTSLMGRMVYHEPINLLHPRTGTTVSFNTSFKFRIVTSNLTSHCGSGLVFAITDFLESPVDSSGDRLGLVNATTYNTTHHFFAVEFDTYWNYGSSSLYTTDPSSSHVGLDFGDLYSAKIANTAYDPFLYLYNNYTFSCWVDYNSSTHLVRVWMFNSTSSIRPERPLLEFPYDLTPLTTDSMYAGFTGNNYGCGSGDQSSAIFSWDFNSDLDGDTLLPALEPPTQIIVGGMGTSTSSSHSSLSAREIGFLVVIGVLFLCVMSGLFIACVVLVRRRRKDEHYKSENRLSGVAHVAGSDDVATNGSTEGGPQILSYKDVVRAAGGFANENKIGEGLSSNVYKGVMPGGAVVAIKRLKEGLRKQADFFSEMSLISKVKHPNLLQLKGWCYHENGEAMLIYDYMSNGSLDSYLFGNRRATGSIPPEEEGRMRMRILNGVAAALDYLHWGMDGCILHRDVKAANVLLTEELEAKLGDFGLARLVAENASVAMTTAMGTIGYVAPEVMMMAKITEKVDVYSFGVLMLEVACGRRAITFMPSGGEEKTTNSIHVVKWIREMWESGMGMAECIMDGRIPAEEWAAWERVVKLGMACCSQTPAERPNMREVYHILQDISHSLSLPPPPPPYYLY